MSTPAVDVQRAAARSRRNARTAVRQDYTPTARQDYICHAAVDGARRIKLARDAARDTAFEHLTLAESDAMRDLYALCLAGQAPAEALSPVARGLLVAELCIDGWTDQQIADHIRETVYTTARIRARLELSPN